MDYRYYRGDDIQVPHKILRHLHRLRGVGLAFILAGIVLPFLTLIGLLKSTFFTGFTEIGLLMSGPILYLVGMVYDTYADRSK